MQVLVAAVIVLGPMPLAVGLVLDFLILTPIKLSFEMSPSFLLWQDWSLGLMALHLLFHLAGGQLGTIAIMLPRSSFYSLLSS